MFQGPSAVRAVQLTRELTRIVNLPRRTWDEQDPETIRFAAELSALIRRPGGTMTLRPVQAMALLDAGTLNGLVGPIQVGGGKTLISGLVPWIMKGIRRPLLITRANLLQKTEREFRELAVHWPIPNFIRKVSYESLGRANHATLLQDYQPDLIICDEAHKLKNPKAAVTRRVARYMGEVPGTRFVAISGTLTHRSIRDYAHLVIWALKSQNAPVPTTFSEIEEWGEAIDEKPNVRDRQVVAKLPAGQHSTLYPIQKVLHVFARVQNLSMQLQKDSLQHYVVLQEFLGMLFFFLGKNAF
jgi:hypothetical protein